MNMIELPMFYVDLQFGNFIQLNLGRAPTWSLRTKLYKFGWNTFPNNARWKPAQT